MKLISLILIVFFYISYLIKNIFLKKRNIKVDQLGEENNEKKNSKFEKILKAFTYIMVIIQIISILIDKNWYYINLPNFFKIIGIIILLSADIIFLLAIITMKNNWRVGISNDETFLVTNGVYKISRNPAFLGFDLLYIGCSILYPNPINIVFTIILILLFDKQIKYEEESLKQKFNKDYIKYCEKVKRYFLFF